VRILEGKGSAEQNNVVVANAAFAIQCFKPHASIDECIAESEHSLVSGNALKIAKAFST
jgi:anthranilate phosphoribosyltransferase